VSVYQSSSVIVDSW